MKTKHYLMVGIAGMGLAGLLLAGCAKKTSTAPTNNPDYSAAQDDQNATAAIEDSKNIADGAAKGQATERMMSGCETWRRMDTNIGGADSAIDIFFGNTDCSCLDHRNRRGHIIVYWPAGVYHYFDSAATISMTFKNYYVNDIGVTGTRTLINMGRNNAGYQTWSFNANLTLTYTNSQTATWNSTRTNTLTNVSGNWYYYVSGSASGTSRNGNAYNIQITSPIVVTAWPWWLGGCAFFESGAVTVNVTGLPTIYATFGTAVGTCSSAMVVTVNSKTYNLTQW